MLREARQARKNARQLQKRLRDEASALLPVTIQLPPGKLGARLRISQINGACVVVWQAGRKMKSPLRKGDVILSLNGTFISDAQTLSALMSSCDGKERTIVVLRIPKKAPSCGRCKRNAGNNRHACRGRGGCGNKGCEYFDESGEPKQCGRCQKYRDSNIPGGCDGGAYGKSCRFFDSEGRRCTAYIDANTGLRGDANLNWQWAIQNANLHAWAGIGAFKAPSMLISTQLMLSNAYEAWVKTLGLRLEREQQKTKQAREELQKRANALKKRANALHEQQVQFHKQQISLQSQLNQLKGDQQQLQSDRDIVRRELDTLEWNVDCDHI